MDHDYSKYGPDDHPKLLDIYAGGDDTVEDPEQEIFLLRLWDKEGQDTAYDLGLSPVRKPAPKGGRKPDAKDFLP